MPAQVALTEAEARTFSSLLRRASDRLETYEEQTHQAAASLRRFALRQTSWSVGSVPIRKRRPDGRRSEAGLEGRLGIFAAQRPITPIDHGGMRLDSSVVSEARGFVQGQRALCHPPPRPVVVLIRPVGSVGSRGSCRTAARRVVPG
jgi:hypothetical protein